MTRVFSVFGLGLALAGSASASFDMLLVPQSGTDLVRRHDPISNLALGSFGAPNGTNLTLDQPNNRVFVNDSAAGFIKAYNYNTGANLGSFQSNELVEDLSYHAPSNSMFFVTDGGEARRLSLTTGLITDVVTSLPFFFRNVVVRDNIAVFSGHNASNKLSFYATNATNLGALHTVVTTTNVDPTRFGKGIMLPFNDGYLLNYVATTSGQTFIRQTYVDTGAASGVSSFFLSGFASGLVMPSLTYAHNNGYFVVGQDSLSATSLRMEGYSFQGALVHRRISTGFNFSATSFGVVNVVAPEPASWLAMGLGLMVLVRRRKS
jgi:hypothetical protein